MTDPKELKNMKELAEVAAQAAASALPETVVETTPDEPADSLCPYCGPRHKERTEEEKKALLSRLRRVEGQIRGIEKMVESGAYCPDILVQVSAATSALNSFNKELLACHIKSCVAEDIKNGNEKTVDELCRVLQKLMK